MTISNADLLAGLHDVRDRLAAIVASLPVEEPAPIPPVEPPLPEPEPEPEPEPPPIEPPAPEPEPEPEPPPVEPPPPPPQVSLAFASAWDFATGISRQALTDNGKWGTSIDGGGPPDRLAVVPALPGFPTLNVLAVRYPNDNNKYWNVDIEQGWPLPPIGGSLSFRLYFLHDVAGGGGGQLHTVQTGPPGNCPYTAELQFDKQSETTFDFYISNYGGSGSNNNQHDWVVRNLAKGKVYRIEEQYTRTDVNKWKADARLYDGDVQIAGAADFQCTYHPSHTLASHTGTITSGNECFRNKMIGNPGAGQNRGSGDLAHQHIYYGGFAVSLSGWIGPYLAGE
jgi:hypothetical protein